MKNSVFMIPFLFLVLSLPSPHCQGALQTASHILADTLIDELTPKTTEIAYLEGGDVILALGRNQGLRFGQLFQIYSRTDDRYLGLVRVIEVRTRNTRAQVLEEYGDMQPGDWADESFGGTAAVYGFLDSQGRVTPFTSNMLRSLRSTLSGHDIFQVMEERALESSLQVWGITPSKLAAMDVIQAGDLLGTDFVVVGYLEEMPQEIILHLRINETATGRMLSNTSLSLTKTSALEALLFSEEVQPEAVSSIAWMEVRPLRPSLLPGESLDLQVFCYDAQGFLIHQVEPEWSVTGDFVRLSAVVGQEVTLYGVYSATGQIRVVVENQSLFIDVEVQEELRLIGILPSPQKVEMAVGENRVFQAQGQDQYGDPMDISPHWEIISGYGRLAQRTGHQVEFTAMGVQEILLQVEKEEFQAVVEIKVVIPMQQAPGSIFPKGLDNEIEAVVENDFLIGETPVTYSLWYPVLIWARENNYVFSYPGREGSHGTVGGEPAGGMNHPVTNVNWNDCIVWCNALSELLGYTPVYHYQGEIIRDALHLEACNQVEQIAGNGFRLPTDDEWELAARYRGEERAYGALEYPPDSGWWWTPGDYASGARGPIFGDPFGEEVAREVAWYRANAESTQTVGQKPEGGNPLGLYDMSGNVWEWCFDGDPAGRIIRGGCWMSVTGYLQVGYSFKNEQTHRSSVKGFRLARSL